MGKSGGIAAVGQLVGNFLRKQPGQPVRIIGEYGRSSLGLVLVGWATRAKNGKCKPCGEFLAAAVFKDYGNFGSIRRPAMRLGWRRAISAKGGSAICLTV